MNHDFDAVLLIGYGGPEAPEEIRPFLRRVAEGRPIPEERLEEVAHHYELIGGRSPLNEYTYKQARALEAELAGKGRALPVYVGMRNWNPFLIDAVKEMSEKGVKKAVGMIMAAHQCDASWERYQRDVEEALASAGAGIEFAYTPPLFDHPLFIEDSADRVAECLAAIPEAERDETMILYSAHSIPTPMAESSPYVEQLTEPERPPAGPLARARRLRRDSRAREGRSKECNRPADRISLRSRRSHVRHRNRGQRGGRRGRNKSTSRKHGKRRP